MEMLLAFVQLLPALVGLWMQFTHLVDAAISAVFRYPLVFLALLLTVGGALSYVYVAMPERWEAVRRYFASGDMEDTEERRALEAMLSAEEGDGAGLADRIHRWTGPVGVKALLLRKVRQLEKAGSPFGSSQVDASERTWIDRVLQVPLGVLTPLPAKPSAQLLLDAKAVLDRTLIGQHEVKLRLLEILSSWLRRPESPPPVLGLLGPPGVGKTTIARCISEVLGRPVQSICFGGRKDSAELKGHSPTYVGAQWGALVQALVDARTMDPVIYCDEVDKIGGFGSEVSHVLLHATDPTQNQNFQDAYLPGVPIDLARVVFVVSVNDVDALPKPLADRIQWVHMKGYSPEDKFDILERSLWVGVGEELGLSGRFELPDDGMAFLVELVEKEPGVRKLRQLVETVLRRAALLQDLATPPPESAAGDLLAEMKWTGDRPPSPDVGGAWVLNRAVLQQLFAWNHDDARQFF